MSCNCNNGASPVQPGNRPAILPTDQKCLPHEATTCSQDLLDEALSAPTKFCDTRLLGLPIRDEIDVIGVSGGCLHRTSPCDIGALIKSNVGGGFRVDNAPEFAWNVARNLVVDEHTGRVITDERGVPREGSPPAFDLILTGQANEGGITPQYIRGATGVRQVVEWDGEKHVYSNKNDDRTLFADEELGVATACSERVALVRERVLEIVDGEVVETYKNRLAKDTSSSGVGDIKMFGGDESKLGTGKLACNGAAYPVAEYPDLFAIIGYRWGGSGAQFRVADLRDRVPRGWSGTTEGRYAKYQGGRPNGIGSYQDHALQRHRHSFSDTIEVKDASLNATLVTNHFELFYPQPFEYVRNVTLTNTNRSILVSGKTTDAESLENGPSLKAAAETRMDNVMCLFYIEAGCPTSAAT